MDSDYISGWIPDLKILRVDSGLQWLDSGFHRPKLPGFRIPDYLSWGEPYTVKFDHHFVSLLLGPRTTPLLLHKPIPLPVSTYIDTSVCFFEFVVGQEE